MNCVLLKGIIQVNIIKTSCHSGLINNTRVYRMFLEAGSLSRMGEFYGAGLFAGHCFFMEDEM